MYFTWTWGHILGPCELSIFSSLLKIFNLWDWNLLGMWFSLGIFREVKTFTWYTETPERCCNLMVIVWPRLSRANYLEWCLCRKRKAQEEEEEEEKKKLQKEWDKNYEVSCWSPSVHRTDQERNLILWCPLLLYGYSYKASCARLV